MMVALHRDIICHPNVGGRRHALVQPTALFRADGVGDGFQRNMSVNVDRFAERRGTGVSRPVALRWHPGCFGAFDCPARIFT